MANGNYSPFDNGDDFFGNGNRGRQFRQPSMGGGNFNGMGFQSNYRPRANLDGEIGENGRDGATRGWLNIGQNIQMPNGEIAFVSINVRGVIIDHIDVQGGNSDFTKARNWLRKQLLNGWNSLEDGQVAMLNSDWKIQMRRTDPANLQGDGKMATFDDDISPFDNEVTQPRRQIQRDEQVNLSQLDNDLSDLDEDEQELMAQMLEELRKRRESRASNEQKQPAEQPAKRGPGRPKKEDQAQSKTPKLDAVADSF